MRRGSSRTGIHTADANTIQLEELSGYAKCLVSAARAVASPLIQLHDCSTPNRGFGRGEGWTPRWDSLRRERVSPSLGSRDERQCEDQALLRTSHLIAVSKYGEHDAEC